MSTVQIPLKDVNNLLTCQLCNGYFQEAHTIPECMHTFCRICIHSYFQQCPKGNNIQCPVCKTEIGVYHVALSKIIFDRNIQSIVDKLIPISQEELQERERLAKPSIPVKVTLQPILNCSADQQLPALPKPNFNGTSKVKILKVQEFVHRRLPDDLRASISPDDIVILSDDQPLDPAVDLRIADNHFQEGKNDDGSDTHLLTLYYKRR